ncbi:MAG: GreA/GreB family elongation factor [Clostridia bacterium]|jgi:hypothetical protein|nr:GreA/GreB family elongation factor [Clostridia bacterium]
MNLDDIKVGSTIYRVWLENNIKKAEEYLVSKKFSSKFLAEDRSGKLHLFPYIDETLIHTKYDAISKYYEDLNLIKGKSPFYPQKKETHFKTIQKKHEQRKTNFFGIQVTDTVLIQNLENNKKWEVTILSDGMKYTPTWNYNHGARRDGYTTETISNAYVKNNTISEKTPLAMSLIGKSVGEKFSYTVADNKIEGIVINVKKNI